MNVKLLLLLLLFTACTKSNDCVIMVSTIEEKSVEDITLPSETSTTSISDSITKTGE